MSLGNAFSYLTILPIPFKRQVPLLRSVHYFPMVGAAMGSVLAMLFVGITHYVPSFLGCVLVIGILEWMTGWQHLRAVAETAMGRKTFPGHGFGKAPAYTRGGQIAIAITVLVKALGLMLMPTAWQPFAVLLLPICGRCALTLGIVFSRYRKLGEVKPDAAVVRRRIRAVFISALLGFLLFLFPLRIGAILALEYALVLTLFFRIMNARNQGLTVQSLGTAAEISETLFLVSAAVLGAI
jgi:adenosylcobinamide-GDP ribazoletransferase